MKNLILIFVSYLLSVNIIYSYDFSYHEVQIERFKYSFKTPDKWDYYQRTESDSGEYIILKPSILDTDTSFYLNFMPYEIETNRSDFPLMYIFVISKLSSNCLDLNTYLDSLRKAYQYELSEYTNDDFKSFKTGDNRKVILKNYSGYHNIFLASMAYLEEREYFVTFALTTRNRKEFEQFLPDFKELIKSYKLISDNASLEKRFDSDFGLIDYDELEKLRKSDYRKYLVELQSSDYLEHAYRNNSTSMLDTFLNAWVISSKPVLKNDYNLKPQIEKEAYDVFKLLYNPKKLSMYSAPYWGHPEYQDENDEIYSDVDYLVIQNRIRVILFDTVNTKPRDYNKYSFNDNDTLYYSNISFFEIFDFAPEIQIDGCKFIYADNSFLERINSFLGAEISPPNPWYNKVDRPDEERRLKFLNQLMKIIPSHWREYYLIESSPLIGSIEFNIQMNQAQVNLTNVYTHFTLSLEKENGNWEVKRIGLGLIE